MVGFGLPRRKRYTEGQGGVRKRRRSIDQTRITPIDSELPEDVIMEILLRLPVKSLLRFRCVSRSWRDLISTRKFITMHSTNNTSRRRREIVSLYCCGDKQQVVPSGKEGKVATTMYFRFYDVPIDITAVGINAKNVRIVGSSNGVVCLSLFQRQDDFAVWNPATRGLRCMPLIDEQQFPSLYDESNDLSCGFYFNPVSGTFKIARFGFSILRKENVKEGTAVHVIMFDSVDYSWREKQLSVPAYCLTGCRGSKSKEACVNGRVYWVIRINGRFLQDKYILCFDMVDELFYRIELPQCCGQTSFMQLAPYKESLALFVRRETGTRYSGAYTFDVWVMNDCGSTNHRRSWSKLLNFTTSVNAPYAEGFLTNCKVDRVVLTTDMREYYLCNPKTGVTKTFFPFEYPFDLFLYSESLASI